MNAALDVPGLPPRFQVEGPLGHGGQAQTLAATDTESGDAVVVKVFRLAGSEAWKRFELFERECAVLRSLEHPGIPRYVAHGGDEEAGVFYLVMQRAGGETLQSMIDRGKRFTDGQLQAMLDGLFDTLAYLHALNPPVIHRDLKPGNVVLGEDGHVWLVDFGSVRDVLVDTRQSTVVGTYGYMAPEQLRGQSSPASDLYGLGATLAAAATGADAAKLPTKGLEVELADVIKPGKLRELLQWMLRADPDQRPGSVAEAQGGTPARSRTTKAGAVSAEDEPELVSLLHLAEDADAIREYQARAGASLADAARAVRANAQREQRRTESIAEASSLATVAAAPRALTKRQRSAAIGAVVSVGVAAGLVFRSPLAVLLILGFMAALVFGSLQFFGGVQRGLEPPDDAGR